MSKYFTLEEMTRSQTAVRLGKDNTPNATQKRDLLRLMDYLDGIREAFGEPIKVTSGFRSWRVNKDVGGGFQQVIYERKGQSVWVHVAIPPLGEMPKQEAMTTNDGKNFTRLK